MAETSQTINGVIFNEIPAQINNHMSSKDFGWNYLSIPKQLLKF